MTQPCLRADISKFENWIFQDALPLWGTAGVDGANGFVEALDLSGHPLRVGFKRVRVHARQIYVFSHAYQLGYADGLSIARNGLSFLLENGWLPDGGGWVVSMGESGGIVNRELDLYDQAFVIFALSWWLRITRDESIVPWIDRTLAVIDNRFSRPDKEGYKSCRPDSGEALQNPHMHLLEALLSLYEVRPKRSIKKRIQQLLKLFRKRLFNPKTGTLGEYFAMDWRRQTGSRGRIVEPGHHYEWYWLLAQAERAIGVSNTRAAEAMFAFAEVYGVQYATNLIYDAVLDDGTIHKGSHRSWTQTERLKALIARAEILGTVDKSKISNTIKALFKYYLSPAPRGAWIDHISADLKFQVRKIPASSFYHIFLSFTELKRCEEALLENEPNLDLIL